MLGECVSVLAHADDRDAAGHSGIVVDEALDEEELTVEPVEGHPSAAGDLRAASAEKSSLESGLCLPSADEYLQPIQRDRPLVWDIGGGIRCRLLVVAVWLSLVVIAGPLVRRRLSSGG